MAFKWHKFGVLFISAMTILLLCALCFFNQPHNDPYTIATSVSPSGKHSITIIGIGEPAFPFGPQEIAIHFDNEETEIHTSIQNDGGEAIVREIFWDGEQVSIRIGGKEQEDVVYFIDFSPETIAIQYLKR